MRYSTVSYKYNCFFKRLFNNSLYSLS